LKAIVRCISRNEFIEESGKIKRTIEFVVLTDAQIEILNDESLENSHFEHDYDARFHVLCDLTQFESIELSKVYTLTIE
jgi:hypothetical protein